LFYLINMQKEHTTIKVGILILIIVAIYVLMKHSSENFSSMYAGSIENPYLEPLSYQLVPNQSQMQSMPNQYNQMSPLYGPIAVGPANTMANMYQQPLLYPSEMYPKIPFYPKTGYPCVEGQCGATSTCVNGFCAPNGTNNTVFNVPVM
jgi:hypothetical protein